MKWMCYKYKSTTTCVNMAFECLKCHKGFDEERKMKRHFRRSHNEKKHVCMECGRAFRLPYKLKIHTLCHNQFSEFLCALCGKRFKRRDKLLSHIIRMHSTERNTKDLSVKPKSLRTKRYRFPKLAAEEVSKFAYKCSMCMIGFHRRGILVNHMTRVHPKIQLETIPQLNQPIFRTKRSFKCHYCERVYMSNGKRKSHIIRSHPGQNPALTDRNLDTEDVGRIKVEPLSCSVCLRQFLTNAKLMQHQRKFHPTLHEREEHRGCEANY